MPSELQLQLQQLRDSARRQKAMRDELAAANQRLHQEQGRLRECRASMKESKAAVKALEPGSLRGLIASVKGEREQQLAAARQACSVARQELDRCEAATAALQRQVQFLQRELTSIGPIEDRLKAALAKVERATIAAGGPLGEQVGASAAWLAKVREAAQRVGQAMATGDEARILLGALLGSLQGARNMGILDMAGGGLIVTALKHQRIDSANQSSEQVQQVIARFSEQMTALQQEFADKFGHLDLSRAQVGGVQMGTFTKYADFMMDGILFDWSAQGRIKSSQLDAQSALDKVTEALEALEQTMGEIEAQALMLRERHRALLGGETALAGQARDTPRELQPLDHDDFDDAATEV